MESTIFKQRLRKLLDTQEALLSRPNAVDPAWDNGVFARYQYPVLTAEHVPVSWRFDFDPATNPFLMERLGVNAVFNAGAIELNGTIYVVARVEGYDRKSFFAVAESANGVDNFRFWDTPVILPETDNPDTNVYDMRLTLHEDGWIYGLFCTERKDPHAAPSDTAAAIAACGIARTRDLKSWERLPDLDTRSPQQRNVVLHPRFVGGKYGLYTRPQDGFLETGSGGGICWATTASMERAQSGEETLIDAKLYHTIKEMKNGAGAPPIETAQGWLHIAHGVRCNAAGWRYVLYAFLCDLQEPWRVTHRPGGYFLAPMGEERIGDVSDVVFINGQIARASGEVFLYYASSDTRLHVATTTVEQLLDYVLHTPEDPLHTHACVQQRIALIEKNKAILAS